MIQLSYWPIACALKPYLRTRTSMPEVSDDWTRRLRNVANPYTRTEARSCKHAGATLSQFDGQGMRPPCVRADSGWNEEGDEGRRQGGGGPGERSEDSLARSTAVADEAAEGTSNGQQAR